MLTRRVAGASAPIRGRGDAPLRRVGHREAAAAHAELAGDRRQREDRHRRAAAVAVALETPAAADQRRRACGVELGELLERGGSMPRPRRRALDRPRLGARAQLGDAGACAREERRGRRAVRRTGTVDRERDRQVGARPHARGADRRCGRAACAADRRRRASRRASAPRARTGTRWMPDADGLTPHSTISARLGVVLVGDRRHLAVERLRGRAGRRRAHRAREARRAEAPEEQRVERVLRQQAVRAAVAERQDRLAAVRAAHVVDRLGDEPSASSHDARRNWPLPLRPVRIAGCRSRSSP